MNSANGPRQSRSHEVQLLDDKIYEINARLSELLGERKSLATKEDIATAKFAMLTTGIAMTVSVVAAIASVVIAVTRVIS